MKFNSKHSKLTSTVGKYSFAPLPLKNGDLMLTRWQKKIEHFHIKPSKWEKYSNYWLFLSVVFSGVSKKTFHPTASFEALFLIILVYSKLQNMFSRINELKQNGK